MGTKERMSNFELLRIIGMLMIIIHHLAQHGLWFPMNSDLQNAMILRNFFCGYSGQIGNWIFILISGWFISNSTFSWKRFFRQWLQVFTISIIIGLILFFAKTPIISFSNTDYYALGFSKAAAPMKLNDLCKCFFPTYLGTNWFIATYMAFYLFIPYLNPYLKSINRKTHFNLTLLMFTLCVIIPFLPKHGFISLDNLFNFIFGYFLANYIRIYKPDFFKNKTKFLILFFTWSLLYLLALIIIPKCGIFIPFLKGYEGKLLGELQERAIGTASIPAIFLFSYFKDVKLKQNNLINTFASTSLGVYLIHENLQLNKVIWHRFFNFDKWIYSPYLILYMLFATVTVFFCCSILELLRKNLIEKPIFKLIDKHWK